MVTMAHHTWHMIGLNKYLINIGHNGPASERVGTKVLWEDVYEGEYLPGPEGSGSTSILKKFPKDSS